MDELCKGVVASVAVIRDKANAFIARRLAAHGLSHIAPAHGSVFYCLFGQSELTMSEVATRINRDKSTITALVDKLVDLGYVEKRKSISDGRVTYVELTETGMALQPVFDEISSELMSIVYQGFSAEERYIFVRLAQRMIGNLTGDELMEEDK